ncbi:MAG: YybH family protein [Streptosporangiaceae bacterium]
MSDDLQAIADRAEIEALRGELTDAVMMRDFDRGASLFTPDGVVLMPDIGVRLAGREQIRALGEMLQGQLDYFVQTTHPGTIKLAGDTAAGRAYMSEIMRFRDGRSELNYGIYHDRYRRTADGRKFSERVYEVRYLDHSPLAGSVPGAAGAPAAQPVQRALSGQTPDWRGYLTGSLARVVLRRPRQGPGRPTAGLAALPLRWPCSLGRAGA